MKRNPKKTTIETIELSHRVELLPEQEGYFKRACGTAHVTGNWALVEWSRQFDERFYPNAYVLKKAFANASPAVSSRKISSASHDSVFRKDQGRRENVHSSAHLES